MPGYTEPCIARCHVLYDGELAVLVLVDRLNLPGAVLTSLVVTNTEEASSV